MYCSYTIPQGYILGPVLFNIYVADLQENIDAECFQYADDTTLYHYAKAANLKDCEKDMSATLQQLSLCSEKNSLDEQQKDKINYLLNLTDVSSTQSPLLFPQPFPLEHINTCKLLGTHMKEHLKWEEHMNITTAACYTTLSVLRKLKHLAHII